MPLKVLLADDSAAIKKVVQLSLQDFGAEIKSVGSGKDVLDVCRSFHPDIAFVDVLLPHKTGYDVVTELKKDAALKGTPVVMLWSAFMAFDEGKFKASGADEKLEKPFEVSGLRSLVTKLVPKVSSSPLARHLDFPKIHFDQPIGTVPPPRKIPEPLVTPPFTAQGGHGDAPVPAAAKAPPANPAGADAIKPIEDEWSMASFEEIGTFAGKTDVSGGKADALSAATPLPKSATSTPVTPEPAAKNADGGTWTGENEWVRKDITSKFTVPIPPEDQEENTVSFQYSENEISDTSFLFKPPPPGPANPKTGASEAAQPQTPEKIEMADVLKPLPVEPEVLTPVPQIRRDHEEHADAFSAGSASPARSILTEDDMAKIRDEVREAVEKAVWKLVPELATQLIKEELQRLLGEDT